MSDQDNGSKLTLSRRRALAGLGTIGAAGALGIGGTYAQFTDTEDSTMSFTAGGIDGTLSVSHSYNGEQQGDFEPEQAGAGVSLEIEDLKPGDFGSITFELEVANNPAWVASCIGYDESLDNDVFEPEKKAESGTVEEDTPGELEDNLMLLPFYDPANNNFFQDGIPSGPINGTDYGGGTGGAFWDLANPGDDGEASSDSFDPLTLDQASKTEGESGMVFWEEDAICEGTLPEGSSLDAGCTVLDGEPPSEYGWGATKTDQRGMSPLQPGSTLSYGFDWHLPFTTGNEVQGDSIEMQLGFSFSQIRHAEGPVFQNNYAPGNNTPDET